LSTREIIPPVVPGDAAEPPATDGPGGAPDTPERTVAEPEGLSLRSNFMWILSGNAAFAACQWGVIVAMARLGSSYMVGQFSLGLAIATPVLMFTNLHLRAVQATDAHRLYSFEEYLRLRTTLTIAGLVAIAGIVWFGHYERYTSMVILAVAFAKGIETLSDIHYGLFQLNDRLDQSGKSMMLRGVLSLAALSAGLYLSRNILWGCVGLALVWLGALLFFDVPNGRLFAQARADRGRKPGAGRGWSLMRTALPLGIATTMATLNLNIPRYFIHARLGERQLGIYSALAYSTAAMILVSDSMSHSAIPRLSRFYGAERLAETRALLLRLVAAGLAIGLAGLAFVQLLGARLLTVLYGPEYAAQFRAFRILILATTIYCVACMFTSAITAARSFRTLVPLYAAVLGANALACALWVPKSGLAGGAAGILAAATMHLLIGAAVAGRMLWAPRRAPGSRCRPCGSDWEAYES
jgi:O-antigen/teichoic acid export membrane protein